MQEKTQEMATNTVIVHPSTTNTSNNPIVRLTITKLLAAVKQGNLEAVRSSLQTYGLPNNGPKTTDYTVLQAALQRKHREIAKLLIVHGCNVNKPTENVDYQSTPLYHAVSSEDEELVYMLLQKGAIIDIRDHRSGKSPAHLAAINRLNNILWKLLHFNINVNFGDSTGKSILHIMLEQAVYHRKTPMETVNAQLVRKIMECKASLNFRAGPHGQTPLHLAALLPQRDILQILLPYVADLNHGDSEFNSVMHSLLSTKYACFGTAQEQTNLDIVNAMLHRGARPDGINKRGQVPAHLAARNRHLQVLLLLLKYEKCINRIDHEGKTILHRLLEDFEAIDDKLLEQYRTVIKDIVSKGGRGDFLSTQGTTALHLAAQKSAKDPNVLWLIAQGSSVDVNVKDKTGKTILHIIANESNPHIELVKLLITKGLRVDIKDDKSGMSPIQIAAKNKNMALLLELLPHSDVNAVDSPDGNTLLHHLLQSSGNEKLVELLLQKGASVDKMNKRGLAPTFYAAETMQISLLLSLLRHSQDLAGQALMKDSQTNRTLLHLVLDASTLEADGQEVLRILLLSGSIIDQLDSRKSMPLHHKVLYNQPDLLSLLVENVSKTNLCGNEGRTLVLYLDKLPLERIQSAEAQVIGLTKMLLNCGASLEGTNAQGKGILELASRNKGLLNVILEYGQEVTTIMDANDNSVLHTHLMNKAENRNLQTVTVLVEKGVPVEAQNKDGETPLHLAAQNGDLEILKLLMEKAENVNLKDKRGNDVLHTLLSIKLTLPPPKATSVDETSVEENAVKPITSEKEKKIVEIIEKLLQKSLTINAVNNAGETHLHIACRSFRMEACRYLLQSGAEPQVRDKLGNSSLHFMAQAKTDNLTDELYVTSEQEMVWYLMSRGCGANDKNHLGQTALHIAAKHGRTHVVEALVSSGADINCIDSVSGATPLHLAAASRRADVIEILVMCGADINSRQTDGSSVLQLVLRSPLKENDYDDGLVFHLLELGADPEQHDNHGKTALHWACWNNDIHGLSTLLNHGASLDAEDDWGFPPLHYATGEKIRIDAVLHLTKLQTAGIAISEKNDKFLKELVETFDLSEGIRSMHYEAEVNLLGQVLIDRKTTLHDLLRMDINTLSYFADNLVLQNLISSAEFETNFAHYGSLIKSCVNMGKIRKELLTAANENLSHLTGTPVPLTCSMKIFDPSFNNESLRCLIKAGTNARPSRKRRSSCNEDEERPSKQPRRPSV